MSEDRKTRLRRLKIRSWRRGTKEMDLILGPFTETEAGGLSDAELDHYEKLLAENDQDLYQWVSGQAPPPDRFAALVDRIATAARTRSAAAD